MKIVCDACQAKYSISDDKVQGKVFKIRCKKCSNIIVVRGGQQSAAEVAPAPVVEKETRVYDYGYEGGGEQAPAGDESVWHVVINQDQVGPMTAAEVQQRFAAGDIDADTYIWREGFSDWLPIAQVDAFSAFVASGSTTAASNSRAGADAVASMFGGGDEAGTVRSDAGDLFAGGGSNARHAPEQDDDGDLFGSKRAPASSTSPPAVGGEAAGSKLRSERNENSVLFSLGNLAQLASDKPAPVTAAPSSGGGMGGGMAGGEGSGLIDIRSMANAYLGGPGGAARPHASAAIGSMDDLPVFGGGGFSEPAVMVPVASSRQNNSKLMYALIGSVGVLAIAAVILIVVLMKGKKAELVATTAGEKPAVGETATGKDPERGSGAPATAAAGSDKVVAVADPGTGSSEAVAPTPDPAAAKPDPTVAAPIPTPARPTTPAKPDKGHQTAGGARPHDPKPDHTPGSRPEHVDKPVAAKPESGGCDEVNCVISGYEGACCAKYKKGGNKTPAAAAGGAGKSDLPDALDRASIADGVAKVKSRVMACGDKSNAKGTVKVSVKVTADGAISSVSVKETPDAGLGSCVASAMQKASFRKTQTGGSFAYPFVF